MSIQNLLVPNDYQLYSSELTTSGDIHVGGSVFSDNGLIYSATPVVINTQPLVSPVTQAISPITLNNGIIFVQRDAGTSVGAFTLTLQLPNALGVGGLLTTLSSLQVGDVISCRIVLDNDGATGNGIINVLIAESADGSVVTAQTSNLAITNNPADLGVGPTANIYYGAYTLSLRVGALDGSAGSIVAY